MSGKLFAEKLHMKAFGPPSWDPIRDNPYAHLWKPAKKGIVKKGIVKSTKKKIVPIPKRK